ncbi:MAG: hypothetical protein OQL19_05085 [Gammaproteobacteria bacterium]|nr:hypothetical protein [Gammaproteobacteria bacterium]
MIRISLIFLFINSFFTIAHAQCQDDLMGARYKMIVEDLQGKKSQTSYMVLWRNGQQVAHQYPELHITELWEQNKKGQLRLVKNFDDHQRGIEYEPNEIKINHNKSAWQKKKLLVTEKFVNTMKLEEMNNSHCEVTQTYSKKDKGEQINLKWLPRQQLVKTFEVETVNKRIYWELVSIVTDKDMVKQLFTSLENYFMTDYSDVGDNESDPFLLKMINLGFVEHGASGIYDQNGRTLAGGGHRH